MGKGANSGGSGGVGRGACTCECPPTQRNRLLQEAMDATFAEEIAPFLLRGILRMSSPSARWYTGTRECKLVLRPEEAARSAEARPAGGLPRPLRPLRVSSSSGKTRPAAQTISTPTPVVLPVGKERLPTRQQAEQAVLAAERAALDSVQFVCGGSVCFGLAQLLSVGQSRPAKNESDCCFWVHTSLAQERFYFRAAKPAEQQRWVHALTELARRRVLAQHRHARPSPRFTRHPGHVPRVSRFAVTPHDGHPSLTF